MDCEGCEFLALPQFLNESMRTLGHVPVTQLQLEIHVPWRLHTRFHSNETVALLRSYALHGPIITPESCYSGSPEPIFMTNMNYPYVPLYASKTALPLLAALSAAGFVPFHIDQAQQAPFYCCNVEYTFLNIRAPADKLPKLHGISPVVAPVANGRAPKIAAQKPTQGTARQRTVSNERAPKTASHKHAQDRAQRVSGRDRHERHPHPTAH